jgi:flagellin-like hook-associated protein FlgL
MSNIALTSGVRNALASIQETERAAQVAQNRLATGKKVNSALDNPTNFFTSANLNSRAQDLTNLLDSMSNSVKTIEAADNGIKGITRLVESAQATVRQAAQTNNITANSAAGAANRVTTGSQAVTGANAFGTGNAGFEAGNTLTFTFGAGGSAQAFTIAVAAGETFDTLAGKVATATGSRATLSRDPNGAIRTTNATGQALAVTAADGTGAAGSAAAAMTGSGLSTSVAAGTLTTSRAQFAQQFDALRTQIDQLARDASFNGKNLLRGDNLTVVFNENTQASGNQSSLTVQGQASDTTGLGIGNASSFNSFATDADIENALSALNNSLTSLRTRASTFGSNLSTVQTRQDFTQALTKTLRTGADNLVLADSNEEGANLVTLNTRQQLATTALSLASQAQQGVLRLF